jgi:hypothetical protein
MGTTTRQTLAVGDLPLQRITDTGLAYLNTATAALTDLRRIILHGILDRPANGIPCAPATNRIARRRPPEPARRRR